jgi:hypothetical protein
MITLVLYIGSLPNLTTWLPRGRGRTLFILGSKVKVTVTINIIVYRLIIYIDGCILWCTHFLFNLFFEELYMHLKYEYYMLFSYQTGYIMWHSRLRVYIPWAAAEGNCASGNIYHKPGMSHYIPSLIAEWQIYYGFNHCLNTTSNCIR